MGFDRYSLAAIEVNSKTGWSSNSSLFLVG
jgi:hypothetical protein